jgi:Ser/Thr protein kinase RdoA (MazF antagonist)
VKLFGELFFGPECHAAERSIQRLLLDQPEIPAPMLVAEGDLFAGALLNDGWPWPYLITTRLGGRAWSDAAPAPAEGAAIARRLGEIMRRVHELSPPSGPTWERDWLAELRARCADRHRERGMLPHRLVEHIPDYLAAPSGVRRLVHADLHADHIFVDDGRLVGVIDWGDAILADPYYDLPALHLLTFRADKELLRAFIAGYGWDVGPDFAHRAMSLTLVHEFNPLGGVRDTVDFAAHATLDELARTLWALS